MDFQVVWTEPAEEDLRTILAYVKAYSATGASTVQQTIMASVRRLIHFPFGGTVYAGRTREIVCLSYRIFYRVDEVNERVEILSVWHSARKDPALPD
jgi:plasmid stabilization system protein ParE